MIREKGRRVFLAGGGTGGHLCPGLAVAEALLALEPETAVAFSSTDRPIDRTVLAETDFPVTVLPARPLRKSPLAWPGLVWSLVRCGTLARRRFREFCPEVVVGLGGFGSYAPVRVGRKTGAATAVLNPDIAVGRANRRLARGADAVFCQFAETVETLGPPAVLTGCPVRPSLLGRDRAEAAAFFGLDPERRTLLVTGASLGARSVNRAVLAMLEAGGLPEGWQVLHLAGALEHDEVRAAYERTGAPGAVRPFVREMGLAYALADLAVARAGASTVAELTATGTPAVLVPYPYHRDQHQMRHARVLAAAGAAVVVEDRPGDAAATARDLAQAARALMADDTRREALARGARQAGRPDAARAVARAVLDLATTKADARHASLAPDVDTASGSP